MTLDPARAEEVAAAYRRYLAAFEAEDMDTINAMVQFPFALLTDDGVQMLDSYPANPTEIKKETGWATTVDIDFEVVQATDKKAHILLRSGRRLRGDGSVIGTISGFYIFHNTAEGWKIFAISEA